MRDHVKVYCCRLVETSDSGLCHPRENLLVLVCGYPDHEAVQKSYGGICLAADLAWGHRESFAELGLSSGYANGFILWRSARVGCLLI